MTDRSSPPSDAAPEDDDLFACLGEYSLRRDAGEEVSPEAFQARLGARFAQFMDLIATEGALRLAIEPSGPDIDLPRVSPARYGDFRAVGEGGMGLVFKATDNTLHRTVAFKVVKPIGSGAPAGSPTGPLSLETPARGSPSSHAFESLRKRFLQEAWVTSGLTHPGIIPIYELGETPLGVPYYTMRFVEGERTLAVAIDQACERAIEDRLALLEPFLKVCDTIRYAHSRGVVHRDLKPQNIAIGTFGEVIVLDWGLAKLGGEDDATEDAWKERVQTYRAAADLRTLPSALGTPGYMAPEAAAGNVAVVDERSDIYSVGVILFEILTGARPFRFDTFVELLERQQSEAAPRADEVDPEVPAALADICAAALRRDRAARPATIDALADRIRAWQIRSAAERESLRLREEARALIRAAEDLSGEALLRQLDRAAAPLEQVLRKYPDDERAQALRTRLAALRERGIRERGARSRRRLMAIGGGLALIVIAALSLVFTQLLRGERDQATERLWQSYRDQARAGRFSRRIGQRLDSLTALEKAVRIRTDAALRNDVLACMPLVDVRLAQVWDHETSLNAALAADPGFRRYARAMLDGTIELRDIETGAELGLLPRQGGPINWMLQFHPEGRLLAAKYSPNGPVRVWDTHTRQVVFTTAKGCARAAFDFHPDGKHFVLGQEDGTVSIHSFPGDEAEVSFKTSVRPYSIRFSPDGELLAVSSMQNRQLVLADRRGQVKRRMFHPGQLRHLAWSPDGRYIATACSDANVYVWRVDGTNEFNWYRVLRGHTEVIADVAFTHGGDLLASTSWDGSVRLWDVEAGDVRLVLPVSGGGLRIAPDDSRLILTAGEHVQVWDLILPREWRRLPAWAKMGNGDVSFDPDGSRLAVLEERSTVIWDLVSWRILGRLPGRRWNAFFFDGGLLLSGAEGMEQRELRLADGGVTFPPREWNAPVEPGPEAERCALSGDGRWVAYANRVRGKAVASPMDGSRPPRTFEHPGATRVGLSRTGAMLVTGTWRGSEVRVWNVASGERLLTLPTSKRSRGLFTPDDRYLIVSDEEHLAVYDTATWSLQARRDAPPVLSEAVLNVAGNLLAASDGAGTILLMDPATLETRARLEPPDIGMPRLIAFSPDGTQLAVARRGRLGVEVWALALIRERLHALGLDWE